MTEMAESDWIDSMAERVVVVIGMRVQLRKTHPCGGDEWTVTRTGADVGLMCACCGRRVMLEREEFERRIKKIVALPESPAVPVSSSQEKIS